MEATSDPADPIGVGNTAWLQLEFYDAGMNRLWGYDVLAANPATNTTSGWMLETVNATAPTGAAFVRETLLFEQVNPSTGTAFFDNATLDVVPEPSTVLLFGIGAIALYGGHRRFAKSRKAVAA